MNGMDYKGSVGYQIFEKYDHLIEHCDDLLGGGELYTSWCEKALSFSLGYIVVLGAGYIVVPQFGNNSGIPCKKIIYLSDDIDEQSVDTTVSKYWEHPSRETMIVDSTNLHLKCDVICLAIPIATWFDRPIGFFWVITKEIYKDFARICLLYAARLVALAVRTTKSVNAINYLAMPIWEKEKSIKDMANDIVSSCLAVLGCKAVIMWEINRRSRPPLLKSIAMAGNIPPNKSYDMPVGIGIAGICAMGSEVIIIDDLWDESELVQKNINPRHPQLVHDSEWHGAIFLPIDIGGETAGVLATYAERVRAFSNLDKCITQSFVQRLAAGYTHTVRLEQLLELEMRLEREAAAIETGILALEYVHDAHNSLGIAQAYIGLIREKLKDKLDSKVFDYTSAVSSNIDDALKLIQILRDGADITKVRLSNNWLSHTLEVVINQVREEAEGGKVNIHCSCPPDLKFAYDKNQIARVFKNLLDNAIYFFQGIQRRIKKICINVEIQEKFVKISFLDNGRGISEDDIPEIFDYFFTTKGEPKGMGFGLAISKRIVHKNHNGRIEVRSKWGEETEFTIYLPYIIK